MSLFFCFFCLFSGVTIVTSALLITITNPIFSVLFLIVSFGNVAALLFLINLEFLPVVLLIVYVGAIAVLFLFVLMTLNLKIVQNKLDSRHYLLVAIFLLVFFIFETVSVFQIEFSALKHLSATLFVDFSSAGLTLFFSDSIYFNEQNLNILGKMLFFSYQAQFLVLAFVLLFAMLGAVLLTLKKNFFSKTQSVYYQVLKNFNNSVTHYV